MLRSDYTTTTYHGDPGHETFNGHLGSYPVKAGHMSRSHSARDQNRQPRDDYSLGFPYGQQQNIGQGKHITRVHTNDDAYNHVGDSTDGRSMSNGSHAQTYQTNGFHFRPSNVISGRPSNGISGRPSNGINGRQSNRYDGNLVNGYSRKVNGSDYLR